MIVQDALGAGWPPPSTGKVMIWRGPGFIGQRGLGLHGGGQRKRNRSVDTGAGLLRFLEESDSDSAEGDDNDAGEPPEPFAAGVFSAEPARSNSAGTHTPYDSELWWLNPDGSAPFPELPPLFVCHRHRELERAAIEAGEALPLFVPDAVSPEDAFQRRSETMQQKRQELEVSRKKTNEYRKSQVAQGKRPPRPDRACKRQISLVTTNCSSEGSLRKELLHGTAFAKDHVILGQELKVPQEGLRDAECRFATAGWRALIQEAYWKEGGYGGGVGLLSRDDLALIEAPKLVELEPGRLAFGLLPLRPQIVAGSLYGVTGNPLCEQNSLWKLLANTLLLLGRPFVIGGDWQCAPEIFRQTGLEQLLDATVVALGEATNVTAGSELDFFLVSNSLIGKNPGDVSIKAVEGTGLKTHRPVRLRLLLPARIATRRAFRCPRLLPAVPPEAKAAKTRGVGAVSWERFPALEKAKMAAEDWQQQPEENCDKRR